jgi:hypothetical protein
LLAAARRDWGGDGWDYDGGERGAAIYAEFMLLRVPRFVEFVRGRPFYVAGDPVPGLTEGLLVTARCLGTQFPAAPDDADFVRILFADVQHSASPGTTAIDPSSWDSATTAAASWRATSGLSPRKALLTQVGVGRGASAVVDVVRLRPIFDALRKSWRVGSPIPSSEATRARPIRNLSNGLGQFQSALDAALRISTKRLLEWRQRVQDALGEDFDKAAIVPIFDAAITAIGDSGLAVGSDLPALRRMLKKFTEYPVKTAYDDIRRIENERAPGFVLDLLAHLDRAMLENVTAFFGAMDSAFEQVDRAAKGQAVVTGADPVADARGALVQTLDDINALLGDLEGEVQ